MRRLPLFLALLGLLLVGAGFTYEAYQRAIALPGAAPLPPSIADFSLVESLEGAAAAENIAHLHRQEFPLSGAAVGTYGNGSQSITLWVSRSPLALLAVRMERAMTRAIVTKETPFMPEETRRTQGRPIYTLTGMGKKHYYFRSGTLLIWLAVDHAQAEEALADILAFYP